MPATSAPEAPAGHGVHVLHEKKLTDQQRKDLPEPMPGSGLGQCVKCQGDLCVANRTVICGRCGMPHRHAITEGWEKEEAARTPAADFSTEQNAGSWIDRILRLERANNPAKLADLLDHQADLIRDLRQRVAALEGQHINGYADKAAKEEEQDQLSASLPLVAATPGVPIDPLDPPQPEPIDPDDPGDPPDPHKPRPQPPKPKPAPLPPTQVRRKA